MGDVRLVEPLLQRAAGPVVGGAATGATCSVPGPAGATAMRGGEEASGPVVPVSGVWAWAAPASRIRAATAVRRMDGGSL